MKSKFIDAQEMQRLNPETFEAPTLEELSKIAVNQHVKICAEGERFWILVTEIKGNRVSEMIDNDLVKTDEHGLKYGDTVIFEKRHIYQTQTPPEDDIFIFNRNRHYN